KAWSGQWQHPLLTTRSQRRLKSSKRFGGITDMTMSSIRKTYIKSIGGAIVMFAFAIFVMPPLYDLFCEVTGIGGKTSGRYEADVAGVDESRTVRVQFVATNNAEMDWDFKPTVFEVKVHPGQPTPV